MRQSTTDNNAHNTHTHTVTPLVRLKCRGNAVQLRESRERGRERARESRERDDNTELLKAEKLCCVQSFNRIQQTAPLFFLAMCVRKY